MRPKTWAKELYLRPFYTAPAKANAHVLFCYRRFKQHQPHTSHDGLGVNCCHMVNVLRQQGIQADTADTWEYPNLQAEVAKRPTLTHCVIEAVWVTAENFAKLADEFPHVHFLARCHSQLAFLQVEPGALKLIDDYLQLQAWHPSFRFAANSERYCNFVGNGYGAKCLWLPNLYPLAAHPPVPRAAHGDRVLKIGSFGAMRLMKNHLTAAGAAMEMAHGLSRELEFHVNTGRDENGGIVVIQALQNLLASVKWAKLVEVPWAAWPVFVRHLGTLDLTLQLSSSETFNLVTADAVSQGVPSVVSSAIDWVPPRWIADADNTGDVARAGMALIGDRMAPVDGWRALKAYQDRGVRQWLDYLDSNPTL